MNKKMIWSLTTMLCLILFSFIVQKRALASDISIGTVNISGTHSGSSHAVVNLIVEEAGYTYQNESLPFRRILSGLKSGTTDIALLVPNPKLDKIATPITYVRDMNFVAIAGQGPKLASTQDLIGKNVGHLRNATIASGLLKDLDINAIKGNNYKQLIQMLLSERIDYIVGPKTNIYWALKELDHPPNKLQVRLLLKKLELHLVYSKKSADQEKISALIAATERLQENNEINKLLQKYDYSTY